MLPVFLINMFGVNRSFHFPRTKCCPFFWKIFPWARWIIRFVFSREGEMLPVFLIMFLESIDLSIFQGRNAARFSDNFPWARWLFRFTFSGGRNAACFSDMFLVGSIGLSMFHGRNAARSSDYVFESIDLFFCIQDGKIPPSPFFLINFRVNRPCSKIRSVHSFQTV